jgi:hypothetical protein
MAEEGAERTGVLVIRAWMSPDRRELTARITGRRDVSDTEETTETAAGAAAAARVAADWLAAFERDGP